MFTRSLGLLLFIACTPLAVRAQEASSFTGVFSDGTITLTLNASGEALAGQVRFDGQTFPVNARLVQGTTLQGTYTYYGQAVPFQGTLQDSGLLVTSEGATYLLLRRTDETGTDASPGTFSDPAWGLHMTPPDGWTAARDGEVIVFSSPVQPGLLVLIPHEATSLDQLRADFARGVHEGATQLQAIGPVEPFGADGLVAHVGGMLEGRPSKMRVVGLLSPYGRGLTLMGTLPADAYTDAFASLVEDVARSVTFSQPAQATAATQASGEAREWQDWLQGCRLSYFERYSSSPGSGYVDEATLDLCPGYFRYGDESGTNFGPGSMASVSRGAGTWQVVTQGGQVILQLVFHDGTTRPYVLGYEEGKTYLDGRRWLRTCNPNDTVVEARPRCP